MENQVQPTMVYCWSRVDSVKQVLKPENTVEELSV